MNYQQGKNVVRGFKPQGPAGVNTAVSQLESPQDNFKKFRGDAMRTERYNEYKLTGRKLSKGDVAKSAAQGFFSAF